MARSEYFKKVSKNSLRKFLSCGCPSHSSVDSIPSKWTRRVWVAHRCWPPPPGNPRKTPEKQTLSTVTASHKLLTLQALSSSLYDGTERRGGLGRGRLLGDLRQPVPQNGRIHLHIIDGSSPELWRGLPLQNLVMKFFPEISPLLLCRVMGIWGWSFTEVFFCSEFPSKTNPKTCRKLRPELAPS